MSLALIKGEPGGQNADVPIGNPLALLLENRIGKCDQLCPRHGPQHFFKVVPAHLVFGVEISMQLSRGPCRKPTQLLQNSIAGDSLRTRRCAKSLRDAIDRCAKIAHSAARTAIGRIAEVVNQRLHAAMVALRKADDLLQLIFLLVRLQSV